MMSLTRKNHDINFVNKLCQSQFNTKVSVTKAFHLGKKGAKPRLLKISLSSDAEKAKIMKSCMKLRDKTTSPEYFHYTRFDT